MESNDKILFLYFIFILIGFPIWYSMVAVPRNDIPLSAMENLPQQVQHVNDLFESSKIIKIIAIEFEGHFTALKSFTSIQNLCKEHKHCTGLEKLRVKFDEKFLVTNNEIDQLLYDLINKNSSRPNDLFYLVVFPPHFDHITPNDRLVIGTHSHAWISLSPHNLDVLNLVLDSLWKRIWTDIAPIDSGIRFPAQPRYQIVFHLVISDPSTSASDWEIENAVNKYINPFIKPLSSMAEFNIQSQIHFYKSIASGLAKLQKNGEEDAWVIGSHNLHSFINVETGPGIINCVLYLPDSNSRPLYILDTNQEIVKSNSFMLPRLGGIVVMNINDNKLNVNKLSLLDLQKPFESFIAQTRELIGLPPLISESTKTHQIELLASKNGVCEWEIMSLKKKHSLELLTKSASQLMSVQKLVSSLSVIPITPEIATSIVNSVSDVQKGIENAFTNTTEFLENAKSSSTRSHEIIFHHQMIPQLYMILEHKIAIYAPFFLPFLVKYLVSVKTQIKNRRKKQVKE
eukprot:c20932_g1_i1.p1 GENE.c20932_g1_i1~~c20932_g1_i1.p1  ORF type:complete len:514 (+),score=165.15 c20932_g1_i1:10-1551(+)